MLPEGHPCRHELSTQNPSLPWAGYLKAEPRICLWHTDLARLALLMSLLLCKAFKKAPWDGLCTQCLKHWPSTRKAVVTVAVTYLNVVQELEAASFICSFSHSPSQIHGPFSSKRPVIAGDRIKSTGPLSELTHQVDLRTGVSPGNEHVCGFCICVHLVMF